MGAERPSHVRGFLAEIADLAEMRDAAYAAAENPPEAWLLSGNLGQRAYGAKDALEALVLTAMEHPDPPTDEELSSAAGLSQWELDAIRSGAPGDDAPAPKRSRFRLPGRRGRDD
ncbi:hypothetical protein [Patulibacter minatonensis]|uniref:hypothetical protein n=1 Tax=Patulibacter minatonensis TaxID=298163 RepID=UPI00047EA643|nr:hypothetical protein [Patulibacter minatonensis]